MDNQSTLRPISVGIPEACRLTGIGRSKLYELIAAGEIDIVKIGAITLVPMSSLEQLIEGRSND
jgi:excisionase family DNA binding protein